MTNKYAIATFSVLVIMSCSKDRQSPPSKTTQNSSTAPSGTIKQWSIPQGQYAARSPEDTIDNSRFIYKAQANTMISSYISSIANSTEDDLKSLTVNADSLRLYLADTNIARIKLIFAHTPEYVASNSGVYSGMKSGALTIIIAGYDSSGNYIYHNTNQVLEHVLPCPYSCPPGYAGGNLLQ